MKRKKKLSTYVSLKWKIFGYMLFFVGLLLLMLWFFQTVYLGPFYKHLKVKDVDKAIDEIEEYFSGLTVFNYEDDNNFYKSVSKKYDMSIMLGTSDGTVHIIVENTDNPKFGYVHYNTIMKFFDMARKNGGRVEISPEDIWGWLSPGGFVNKEKIRDNASPYIAKIVSDYSGREYILVIHSQLTPVTATVHTLRIQLIIISVIMILLSLCIAFIVSKSVSRSIIKVNESAKELAEGNYDVKFDGMDYKEITELSDTLNHTAVQLGKAELLQQELIANVSHDLRTPLTMITAYSEIMRDIPGENTPENVQIVIDEAKRLTVLVNDLMDISKIQAGVSPLETKEYDLTESINTIIDRSAKMLEPYGYSLVFDFSEHVLVEADEFKMYQVIYNLIGNAVNYSGEDKKVNVIQKLKGDTVRIEVTDHGNGIPKEELDTVWERYYKVNKNHKRAVIGTGLGLSIVKNILKLHNAEFGVDSVVGEGSSFWFELKITEAQ